MKTYAEIMESMQSKIAGMPPAKRAKAQAVLSANKASAKKVNAPQAAKPKSAAKAVGYGQQPKYTPHQGNKEKGRRSGGNKSSALALRPSAGSGAPNKKMATSSPSALAKRPQSGALSKPQSRPGGALVKPQPKGRTLTPSTGGNMKYDRFKNAKSKAGNVAKKVGKSALNMLRKSSSDGGASQVSADIRTNETKGKY